MDVDVQLVIISRTDAQLVRVGAGVGERVVLTSDGRGARELLRARATPVRWTIVAIEDPKAA